MLNIIRHFHTQLCGFPIPNLEVATEGSVETLPWEDDLARFHHVEYSQFTGRKAAEIDDYAQLM
jgi:hypothetical protein